MIVVAGRHPETPDGGRVVIEVGPAGEIRNSAGLDAPPACVEAFNPVFDVTPGGLVDIIVTERGVVQPRFEGRIAVLSEASEAR